MPRGLPRRATGIAVAFTEPLPLEVAVAVVPWFAMTCRGTAVALPWALTAAALPRKKVP